MDANQVHSYIWMSLSYFSSSVDLLFSEPLLLQSHSKNVEEAIETTRNEKDCESDPLGDINWTTYRTPRQSKYVLGRCLHSRPEWNTPLHELLIWFAVY